MLHQLFFLSFMKITVLLLLAMLSISGCANQQKKQEPAYAETLPSVVDTTGTVKFNSDSLQISEIDSAAFAYLRTSGPKQHDSLFYIKDFGKVKKMLKGRVVFSGYNENADLDSTIDGEFVSSIQFKNGKLHYYKTYDSVDRINRVTDVAFVAYYPSEDILFCEGGHSSDYSFNLTTGEQGGEVGNPGYIRYNPSKSSRLNGYFPGQECDEYFIQKKTGTGFKSIFNLRDAFSFLEKENLYFCFMTDVFWHDDHTLYFKHVYFPNTEPVSKFYRIHIRKI